MVKIKIQNVREVNAVPIYAHETDAGMDIRAAEDVNIPPGCTVVVPTGIAVAIPKGYEIQVRARSGYSAKTKLRIANSPGTIDSGYRGEIGVIIDNISKDYIWGVDDRPHRILPHILYDISGKYIGSTMLPNVNENANDGYYQIKKGDRIAQLVLCRIEKVDLILCDDVSLIDGDGRGTNGYGSSGTK